MEASLGRLILKFKRWRVAVGRGPSCLLRWNALSMHITLSLAELLCPCVSFLSSAD